MQTLLSTIANIFARLGNSTYGFENAVDVWHYNAPQESTAPYIIWAEDDRIDLEAGNVHAEKSWQGSLNLYTHTEFDPIADDVETLLDDNGFIWRLEDVVYEEEERLIHYSWVWTYA